MCVCVCVGGNVEGLIYSNPGVLLSDRQTNGQMDGHGSCQVACATENTPGWVTWFALYCKISITLPKLFTNS